MEMDNGRKRVVIEDVSPEIDAGRFPVKRVVGEEVIVEAAAFADSHDAVSCTLLYRRTHFSNSYSDFSHRKTSTTILEPLSMMPGAIC